jgi:DNA-binding MarR family transcriptional regulator
MPPGQYACLEALHDSPGITSSELGRRTFVSRQSMNVLLQGLVDKGLVERSTEPGPRRALAATLTPGTSELLRSARDRVSVVTQRMTAALDEKQRDQLGAALASCCDALLQTTPAEQAPARTPTCAARASDA